MNKILILCFIIFLSGLQVSCSDNASNAPAPSVVSSAKAITSFKLNTRFSGIDAPVFAIIDEAAKKLNVNAVIETTNLNDASAVVMISPKATIQPDPNQSQDYTKPVTYTVTAEDGTSATYTVVVTRAAISITSVTGTFEPGSVMVVNGANFANCSCGTPLYVVDENNMETQIPSDPSNTYSTTQLSVKLPIEMEIGTYQLKARLTVGTDAGIDTFEGVYANPIKIDIADKSTKLINVNLSKTTNNSVNPPLITYQIFVEGRFLGNTTLTQVQSAKLYLVQVANPTTRVLMTNGNSVSGSSKLTYFGLDASVPPLSMPPPSTGDKFYVEIEYEGVTTRYAEQITYPW